jgi:hypothetical protein
MEIGGYRLQEFYPNTSRRPSARLFFYRMMRTPQQNLRGPVSTLLPAERTGNDNRLKRKDLDAGRYVAPTPLASDYELLSLLNREGRDRTSRAKI